MQTQQSSTNVILVYNKNWQLIQVYRNEIFDDTHGILNIIFNDYGCIVSSVSIDSRGLPTAEWLDWY